jgi:hypothetical protein
VRLTSNLWVMAYLRQCRAHNLFATVARHGDDYAGAIHIKVNRLDGTASVYGPAPSVEFTGDGDDRRFAKILDDVPDTEAEAWLARQKSFDSDIWVIEIEDRQGRHLLDDLLYQP